MNPYTHPCGRRLDQMVQDIRRAIMTAIMRQYHAGISPNAIEHFWYVHQGWHNRTLHPAVHQALLVGPPKDLHQLVLESPHVATDQERLAYIQNDQKGRRDIQTVTTAGKYLKRHFPHFKDEVIRSLAECKTGCRFIRTMREMLHAIKTGPRSCMKWDDDRCNAEVHPYESYDPKYGWGMAINEENGVIIGRALVNFDTMKFVRTYRATPDGVQSCNLMQAWLKEKGFEHAESWGAGQLIKRIDGAAPYLDGGIQRASQSMENGEDVWVLSEGGSHELCRQDGNTDDNDNDNDYGCCDDCGASQYEGGDHYYVGIHEDTLICSDCIDDYMYVIGRGGNEYYTHQENAVCINDQYYDSYYLSDQDELTLANDDCYYHNEDVFYCSVSNQYYPNGCYKEVEMADGDYAEEGNTWTCGVTGDCYSVNDEDECQVTTHDGRIAHKDNVWQSMRSLKWYGDDEEAILQYTEGIIAVAELTSEDREEDRDMGGEFTFQTCPARTKPTNPIRQAA